MNETDKLRATCAPALLDGESLADGDFARVDGELYAIKRARVGIGVTHHPSGKVKDVLYRPSESLFRIVPPSEHNETDQ